MARHTNANPLRKLGLLVLGLGTLGSCKPPTPPTQWPQLGAPNLPIACRPDRSQTVNSQDGRDRFCMIDVGSRNVKLVVTSLKERTPSSMVDERQCRTRMQLGDKTFNQATQTGLPLPTGDQASLVNVMKEYLSLCLRDGGHVVGAVSTEWARRATNQDEIQKTVKSRTGVALEILTRDREGRYGYLAATRGQPGKIVLDFGSRSFQLSFWAKGAPAPETAGIPLGIDEAGDRFFGKSEHTGYGTARAAFLASVRAELAPVLEHISGEIKKGTLEPVLFSLGENGDVGLALGGKLWDAVNHKGVDDVEYSGLLRAVSPRTIDPYGLVTAVVPARDIASFTAALDGNDRLFEELRSNRIKRIYGNKMMAFPSLMSMLTAEIGVETIVLVPQEMPDGFVVEKLSDTLR